MPPAVIENPILNSPFREPARHWQFTDEGITSNVVDGRRRSTYFIPIAKPKKTTTAGQLNLTPEGWTAERMTENDFINRVRDHVAAFRRAKYPGVTPTTRELLDYWTDPDRAKPLFFCQIEALEAASLTKKVLVGPDGDTDRYRESPQRVVRRVLGTLDRKRNVVVLNDEAHHCYQSAPQADGEAGRTTPSGPRAT